MNGPVLFPYDTLFGDVSMSIDRADLDGREFPVDRHLQESRASLYNLGKATWKEIELFVTVRPVASEIQELEEQGKRVGAVARLICRRTNVRQGVVLKRAGDEWIGSLRMSYEAFVGSAMLDALILDETDKVPRIIGYSDTWTIEFVEKERHETPMRTVNTLIDVQWADFKTAKEPFLVKSATEFAYFDLTAKKPTLWLNAEFDELRSIMDKSAHSSAVEAMLYDLPSLELASRAWTAMFTTAAASLESANEDEFPPLPEGWQGAVLSRVLPLLYEGLSQSESLRRLISSLKEDRGDAVAVFQSELSSIIDRMVGESRALRAHTRKLDIGGDV